MNPAGVVDLTASFAKISEHWRPKVIAELNGQEVKLVKIQGEFVWHHHDHEDELFLVHRGHPGWSSATGSSSSAPGSASSSREGWSTARSPWQRSS